MQVHEHHSAVLGSPIAHSLSPVLHQAAYQRMGLHHWHYFRREVHESDVCAFLESLDSRWAGVSLTMPLKRAIMPFGEAKDTWSRRLNVANTAVFDWYSHTENCSADTSEESRRPAGRMCEARAMNQMHISLFNTDVEGIIKALQHAERGRDTSNVSGAVIIGSGNTAASAVAACASLGITHLDIIARNRRALQSLHALCDSVPIPLKIWALDQIPEHLTARRFIISTLPAHAADPVAALWQSAHVSLNATVLDVVYKPRPSMLVKASRQLGACAITGEEMLIYQAIPQVALMTHTTQGDMPRNLDETMRQAVQEALK